MMMTTNVGASPLAQSSLVRLPLFFKYTDQVIGHGFVATVTVRGRVLCSTEQDGSCWMYGVSPGGIDAGGKDPGEAHAEFRQTYREVLLDIVEDATPEKFELEVKRFIEETNDVTFVEWRTAVDEIRAGHRPQSELEILDADTPIEIQIRIGKTLDPEQNVTKPQATELLAA